MGPQVGGRAPRPDAPAEGVTAEYGEYLIELGIAPERLTVNAYGEDQPWKTGRAEAARAQNRRVEFRIRKLDEDLATLPVAPGTSKAVEDQDPNGAPPTPSGGKDLPDE